MPQATMNRRLELSTPSGDIWGKGRDWRLTETLMANELINHACVMKHPKQSKGRGAESSQIDKYIEIWEE